MYTDAACTLVKVTTLTLFFPVDDAIQHGTEPSEAVDPSNSQPYIVLFTDDDDDECQNQLFIVVERELMMETANIVSALFNLVAAHYVFNLDYNIKAKDLFRFLQEKVFSLKPTEKSKKGITVASHTSGIARYYGAEHDMI